MSLSKQLFRESALERLSSPEQLDKVLQVTSPKGWISLMAIWLVLGAIVAWSIVGKIPTQEDGRGMLVAGGGLKQVVTSGAGRLRSVNVEVGRSINEGQVVAEIDKQDILDAIAEAESRVQGMRRQQEELAGFDRKEEELQASLAQVERKQLEQVIEFARERNERLTARKEVVRGLVREGNMTPIDIERLDEEVNTGRDLIEKSLLEIEQLDARTRNASFQRERDRLTRKLSADELERSIEVLKSRHERESRVVSPFAGRVIEIRAAVQSTVGMGEPILLLEPKEARTGKLEAVVYVSAVTGKRVQPGMSVEITPSTVKREEHGSMVGKVKSVADTPTSKSAMMVVLSDQDLVERFVQTIGLPLQVVVEFEPDTATHSGYKWTSAQGPPIQISAGTLCDASIQVREQSPISLVIPLIRRATGGE